MQYNLLFRWFVGLGVDGGVDWKTAWGAVFPTTALMDEAGSAIGPRNPPQGHGLIVQGDLTRAPSRQHAAPARCPAAHVYMRERGAMDGHAERRAAPDPRHGPRTNGGTMARCIAIPPDRPGDCRLARTKGMTPPSLSPAYGRPASPCMSRGNHDIPPSPLGKGRRSPAGQRAVAPPGTTAAPCP